MKKIKIVGNIIYGLMIAFLVLVSGALILTTLEIPGSYKLYTVQSGSMEPAIKTGSIVISRPADTYEEGDIITFKSEDDSENPRPQITTTHRIVGVSEIDGQRVFTTKGDANSSADGTPVSKDLILGKVIFSIPLMGYLVGFSRTQLGLIVLIIIPATIIVFSELQNIQKEIKKIIEKRKKIIPEEQINELF